MSGQDAMFIASVCMYSTGHWIGGTVLIIVFVASLYMMGRKFDGL